MKIHGQIQYVNSDGNLVHSDICPCECSMKNVNDEYRSFLHELLDEWLLNSNGTYFFFIGNVDSLKEEINNS